MAKIIEYRDIPLDALVIGKGQARVQNVGQGIEDLAKSIEIQGLLQPIVVCSATQEGKYEILTGQRRFLAHQNLRKRSITAAILDERVSEGQAKAISITENLIRRKLSGKELKDGILYLYNLYGTIKDVVDTTGLPRREVQNNLKYPRLSPELKKMVDDQEVDINVAVSAHDAATVGYEESDPEIAIQLAQEMNSMSGEQRKRIIKDRKNNPDKTIEDVIEDAKTSSKITQIVASVSQRTHSALQQFAKEESCNQNEAATTLIEEALIGRGLLEE